MIPRLQLGALRKSVTISTSVEVVIPRNISRRHRRLAILVFLGEAIALVKPILRGGGEVLRGWMARTA